MLQSPTVERKPENAPDPDNEDTSEREQLERLLRGYIKSKHPQETHEPEPPEDTPAPNHPSEK